jgi:hypothetical protein|tara:strand:- start:242 stop:406 length:165 start_codon:yes stop_codon:yes gene_type:complete
MEEVIVEGLDYEDFVSLKSILTNCTSFTSEQQQLLVDNTIIVEKIDKILQVFDE